MARKNKRSLKNRIRHMLSFINWISVVLISILIFISVGTAINQLGTMITNYISYEMAEALEVELEKDNEFFFDEYLPIYEYKYEITEEIKRKINHKLNNNSKKKIYIPSLVEYRVWENGNLVYASTVEDKEHNILNYFSDKKLILKFLDTEAINSVRDDNGNILAEVGVRLNPNVILFVYCVIFVASIIVLFLNLMISKLLSGILVKIVVKPLKKLETKMNELAEGNIEVAMHSEIQFKKPISEVESLTNSTNKIMSKMEEYVALLQNHKDELEAQNIALEENGQTLKTMNMAYQNRTLKLQNLLNNVGQGFFTFNKDLMINPEYSLECERMFGCAICKNKFSEVVYEEKEQQEFIDDLLTKIFESDKQKRDLYMPLLPEEINKDQMTLRFEYKIVRDENLEEIMMVIITDITHTRKLEKQMNEERNILKMIVKVLLHRNEFLDLIKDYKKFSMNNFKFIRKEKYHEILREIHTFKGNFSQYYMINTVELLNNLEDKLYEEKQIEMINDLNYHQLYNYLQKDITVIESYVGFDLLNGDELYVIKKDKIIQIEKEIIKSLSNTDCKMILPLIQNLRYRPVKDLLKSYPDYATNVSERLNKSIKPFDISGDEIFIDPVQYQKLFKTLVHVFRNCVDHGIETEDERVEVGKPQWGIIECKIKNLNDSFQIAIADDGRGIDLNKIKQKALEQGIVKEEILNEMTEKEIVNLIFKQGMSTKDKATVISGRGVGLPAVKEAVKELNGKIEIESVVGQGAIFKIWLPKIKVSNPSMITPNIFLHNIQTVTEKYFDSLNISLKNTNIIQSPMIKLNNFSALISINGSINAIVIISVNEAMGRKLVKSFMMENIDDNEIIEYIDGVLGEAANTILGNVMGEFDEEENIFLHMGLPAMLLNKSAFMKYPESEIFSLVYDEKPHRININVLLLEKV